MTKCIHKPFLLIVLVLFCSLTFGCNSYKQFTELPSVDKATVVGTNMSNIYKELHEKYVALYEGKLLSQEKKDYMTENINPVMNKTKYAIAAYLDAVALWRDTSVEPSDMLDLTNNAWEMLETLRSLYDKIKE